MTRQALPADLDVILEIYEKARAWMRQTGNPDQWKDTYPEKSILENDIARGQLYLMEDEEGPYAVFALIGGEDPTYRVIDGKWLYGTPYHTLHRVASTGRKSRVFAAVCVFASTVDPHLRVDTHEKNLPMQRAIAREGFHYCGVIHLLNGEPRLAFERQLKEAEA